MQWKRPSRLTARTAGFIPDRSPRATRPWGCSLSTTCLEDPNERKHTVRTEQRGTQADGCKPVAPDSPHRPLGGRDSRDEPVTPPDSGARPGVNRALTPGRRRRVTENDEYAAFARRVLRAWARRVAAGDIDAITDMAAAVGELEDAMRQGVAGLRDKGYSWAEIAARLGVTRQAAQQRWGGGRDLLAAAAPRLAASLTAVMVRRRGVRATGRKAGPAILVSAARCALPPHRRRPPLTAGRHSRPRRSTGRSNAMRVKEALAEAAGQEAASYLKRCGFRVLDRNWRSGSEILPIIAVERHTLVVIDLRVRAGTRHGTPLEAISADRRKTLRRLAGRWLTAHGVRFDQIRIDAVGLLQESAGGFTIEHIRAVG